MRASKRENLVALIDDLKTAFEVEKDCAKKEKGEYCLLCPEDGHPVVLPERIAHYLDTPTTADDLYRLISDRMTSAMDRCRFDAAHAGGKPFVEYVRLRGLGGVYWWRIHETVCGGLKRWCMRRFDEAYFLRLARRSGWTAGSGVFEKLLAQLDASSDGIVWYLKNIPPASVDGAAVLPFEDGSAAVIATEGLIPQGGVRCGTRRAMGPLLRELALQFKAARPDDRAADQLAKSFLCLGMIEGGFEAVTHDFQPIVRNHKTMLYIEMLARLRADGLNVSPGIFIPMLENGEGMIPFGRFTFERAVLAAKRLIEADLEHVVLSFNYSPVQSLDASFADFVEKTLAQHGVPASALCIELTETADLPNPTRQSEHFEFMRLRGMQTAIDDFGSGFNTVEKLLSQKFSSVKFGGDLARRLASDPKLQDYFMSMVGACKSLGSQVIVECVETHEEEMRLLGCNIDLMQGWHFGRPMSIDAIIESCRADADSSPFTG